MIFLRRRAREKRERLRSAHYAPDYMPLEGSNAAPSSKDPNAVTTGTGILMMLPLSRLSFATSLYYHAALPCCQPLLE